MKIFEAQLLRLKQATNVLEEKDIADLLGMHKSAFSARKKRDVFPEEKLWALAHKRPDLNIDVLAVLTGISSEGHAKIAALNRAAELLPPDVSDYKKIKAHKAKTIKAMEESGKQNPRESQLLARFRASDESGKKLIEGTAKLAAQSAGNAP